MDERRRLDQDLERAWEELQELHLAMHPLTHPGPDAEFRVMETLEAVERYAELLQQASKLRFTCCRCESTYTLCEVGAPAR